MDGHQLGHGCALNLADGLAVAAVNAPGQAPGGYAARDSVAQPSKLGGFRPGSIPGDRVGGGFRYNLELWRSQSADFGGQCVEYGAAVQNGRPSQVLFHARSGTFRGFPGLFVGGV